jgi:hypothetical protein
MPKRSEKGAYREHQERLWRHDKRRPRRTRIEIIQDLGRSIEKDILTFPSYVTLEQKEIPKQSTGLWEKVWNHVIKIVVSKQSGRFYVYDLHGEFLGELSENDLYDMSVRCLGAVRAFREEIHKSRKGNVWIVRILKNRKQLKQ